MVLYLELVKALLPAVLEQSSNPAASVSPLSRSILTLILTQAHSLPMSTVSLPTCSRVECCLTLFAAFQHHTQCCCLSGEVFVLDDGGEVDLDLGNYERFLDIRLTKDNNLTTGKIYQSVIMKERRGDYLGKTVQGVYHE